MIGKNDSFVLLYSYAGSYRPYTAFSNEGPVDKSVLEKVYGDHFPQGGEFEFTDLSDLKKYTYLLTQELKKWGCYLVSAEDYNDELTDIHHQNEFKKIFEKVGEVILNDEYEKNKSFLKRILD